MPPTYHPAANLPRRSVFLAQTWWQDRVLSGVAKYASSHNWHLNCRMHWTHDLTVHDSWHCDGIIAYVGVSFQLQRGRNELIDFIRTRRVPVVEIQSCINYFQAPSVELSQDDIGMVPADYFLGLGFTQLGYVAFDENLLEQRRREGFRRVVEAAGQIFHALSWHDFARELAAIPKPVALLAMNDMNAIDVMVKCLDLGYRVPEEVAVMGVDDTNVVCDHAVVPLTSLNCNYELLGFEAAKRLDRLMAGDNQGAESLVVPLRGITVRQSTDIIAIPDLDTARFLRRLRAEFRSGQSVQQIADGMGISLRRIYRFFKRHVGRSPLEELTRLRVEDAKTRLADPRRKLSTVAIESGFSSRFHLIAAFNRVVGESPKAYRNRLRKLAGSQAQPSAAAG